MSSVQSIERAFAVLGTLANGSLGVTEVAERAGLPKSTAARLLATLAREGVVEQVPGDTAYRLGPRLATLAAGLTPARSLTAIAHPVLIELAAAVGEAAGLSVPDGDLVHYIDQVDTPNPVSVRDWTGSRVPMHAVSSGQVLLAFRPHCGAGSLPRTAAGAVHARTPSSILMRFASDFARSVATASPGSARSSTRASRRSRHRSPTRPVR